MDSINDFNDLIHSIQDQIEHSQLSINQTLQSEKTFSYWQIGRTITDYLQKYSLESTYGLKLFSEIAGKINIGRRILYTTVQFFQSYPERDDLKDSISWGHYRVLSSIRDKNKRLYYEALLSEQKLSTRELIDMVKKDLSISDSDLSAHLKQPDGRLDHYPLKLKQGRLMIDLGFHNYFRLPERFLSGVTTQSIIEVLSYDDLKIELSDLDKSQCFTYKAFIKNIIDGDTITVDIDLGFNILTTHTLRLNGIDCPELPTEEGQKAKAFVEQSLSGVPFIVIKTYRPDKYSRYLVDVFYSPELSDPDEVILKGSFLNQELLDQKLAQRYYIY
jgi:micrococcal nuclease